MVPKYESKVTLLLIQSGTTVNAEESITQTDLNLNNNLIGTYRTIIKSKTVLEKVIKNLDLNMTEDELYKSINVNDVANTQTLEILVQSENPKQAKIIADEVAKVFSDTINQIYKIDNVKIIDEAYEEDYPCNINHVKNMSLFLVIGMTISVCTVLLVYLTDTTIKEESDVEEFVELPVVISLPVSKTKDKKNKDLITFANAKSTMAENFRTLRTNLIFAKDNDELKNILITSCNPGEGKTYVSSNLAITFAKVNKKVILVDADMRKGRVHNIFQVDNKTGLSNYLEDLINGNKITVKQTAKYIKETNIPNLHVMTSGERPLNPSELISSPKMLEIIKNLDRIYDVVIIDGTPSSIVSDSIAISKFINTILIVAEYKKTKIETLKKVKKQLDGVNSNITGVVLNKCQISQKEYGDGYYSDIENKNALEEKNEKIRTVKDFLEDIEDEIPNDAIVAEEYEIKTKRKKEDTDVIREIKKEVSIVKNLFVQYVLANQKNQNKISDGTNNDEKINELKKEIESLKRAIKAKEKSEKIFEKDLIDEVINLRKAQEELKNINSINNEKIDELIENYRKKLNSK